MLGIPAIHKQTRMASEVTPFAIHDGKFRAILGTNPTLSSILENAVYPFAHEAGVFIAADDTLFITSNQLQDPANPSEKKVQISKVTLSPDRTTPSKCEELDSSSVPMGNGGVNYRDGIIFCAQ